MEMNKGSIDSSSIVPPRLEDAGLEDCALSPKGIKEAFMRAAQAVKSTASTILNKNDGDCIEVGGPSDGEWTDDLQDYSTEGGRWNQSCVESLAGGLVEEGRDKVVDIGFDGDIGDEVVDVGPSQKKHLWEEDDDDGGCVPGLKGLLPDPAKVEGDDDEEKEEVPILIEAYV